MKSIYQINYNKNRFLLFAILHYREMFCAHKAGLSFAKILNCGGQQRSLFSLSWTQSIAKKTNKLVSAAPRLSGGVNWRIGKGRTADHAIFHTKHLQKNIPNHVLMVRDKKKFSILFFYSILKVRFANKTWYRSCLFCLFCLFFYCQHKFRQCQYPFKTSWLN